jgi:hypothetical protein
MSGDSIALGVGLGVFGVAFYVVSVLWVRDDGRMRKLAESRWPIDRRIRKIRRGEMSQEQWFTELIRNERALVKWMLTPFIVLWLAVCIAEVVHGLTSH